MSVIELRELLGLLVLVLADTISAAYSGRTKGDSKLNNSTITEYHFTVDKKIIVCGKRPHWIGGWKKTWVRYAYNGVLMA